MIQDILCPKQLVGLLFGGFEGYTNKLSLLTFVIKTDNLTYLFGFSWPWLILVELDPNWMLYMSVPSHPIKSTFTICNAHYVGS